MTGSATAPPGTPPGARVRVLLTLGLPAVAALAAGLWRLGTPVLWQDETATVEAARLPLPRLAHLVRHVDLVHAAYYLFMHGVIEVLGVSTVAVRLPSVAATVLAAAGVAAIGRRLQSNRAGLAAGLIYAMPARRRAGKFRPPLIAAALGALLVLSYPPQVAVRLPAAKGPDTRQAFAAIQRLARPGDAVAYVPGYRRTFAAAYPRVFANLNDVALAVPAGRAAAFGGREVGTAELTRRLRGVSRVWVVRISSGVFGELTAAEQRSKQEALTNAGLVAERQWSSSSLTLTL